MKKSKNPFAHLADMADLPQTSFDQKFEISLLGNREMFVDGCRGIIDYGQEEIMLNLGRTTLKITGKGLNVRSMNGDAVHICGSIYSVEFDK